MLLSDKKEMDRHKQYLSKYCRLCDKQDENLKYSIQTFAAELEFEYKVDISKDDADSQSSRCCRACYRTLQKVREKMVWLRKNPSSKKVFSFKLPAYSDNMKVHTTELGCPCLVGVEVEVAIEAFRQEYSCRMLLSVPATSLEATAEAYTTHLLYVWVCQ